MHEARMAAWQNSACTVLEKDRPGGLLPCYRTTRQGLTTMEHTAVPCLTFIAAGGAANAVRAPQPAAMVPDLEHMK